MSKTLTTNKLIQSVKRRASIPENQQTFLEDDFLAFANEEMDIGLVPHVLSYHQEYFVYTQLVPLESEVERYEIPTRAVGNRLRDIAYQDENESVFEMTQVNIDDISTFQANSVRTQFTTFYTEATDIVLLPKVGPSPVGFLRFTYYLRPNEIVSESRVSIITNINRITGEITVNDIPDNISVTEPLDLIQTKAQFKTLALDVTALSTDISTNVITFALADIPAKLVVGDHIALAGETIVPQVPSELHSMLAQRVATRCLESLGDTQGLGSANTKLAEMEQKTGMLIDNRVEGAPHKVTNRHGMLNRRNRLWW